MVNIYMGFFIDIGQKEDFVLAVRQSYLGSFYCQNENKDFPVWWNRIQEGKLPFFFEDEILITNINYTKVEPTDKIKTRFEPRLVLDYDDFRGGEIEIYHVLFSCDSRRGEMLCAIPRGILDDPVFDMTTFLRYNIIANLQLMWSGENNNCLELMDSAQLSEIQDGQPDLYLWAWQFDGKYLSDIDITSDRWAEFKSWLEKEEAYKTLTQYPTEQLVKMRELVNLKDGGK